MLTFCLVLQDWPIKDDSSPFSAGTRLISAWGDEAFGYHGPNVARSTVRLFAEQERVNGDEGNYHERMQELADGSLEIRENNFVIPIRETTYHTVCLTYEALRNQSGTAAGESVTMIGAGPVISNSTRQFVHHFIVYSSTEPESCEYTKVIYGWAPGEAGMELPGNVGIPLLGDGETKSIVVEIHYNNPENVANQVDSSGVRLYFSKERREYDAAILQLGDPLVQLDNTAIGEGLTEWSFECASSCSSLVLGGESVTVFGETLHMHKSGTRMVNEQIRGGKVIHEGVVDVFEFDQQGSYNVPIEPFQIQPGDSFRTTCYYRDGTEFGLSSQQEMCSEWSRAMNLFCLLLL